MSKSNGQKYSKFSSPRLILASGSPRRVEILNSLGLEFNVIPPGISEEITNFCPYALALINAVRKSEGIAQKYPENLVLGADTLIEANGKIIGKPANQEEAKMILKELSGRKHQVITGVCLRQIESDIKCVFCEKSTVEFKNLTDRNIADYISCVNTLDKAGAYAIQEHGNRLIKNTTGSLDNIVGLPKKKLAEALKACGLFF